MKRPCQLGLDAYSFYQASQLRPWVEGTQFLRFFYSYLTTICLCYQGRLYLKHKHNKNKMQNRHRRVGKQFKNKLKRLCSCPKNHLHTFMILLSPSCQYKGIKLQEKGGSISCRPQTTLQFLVLYFDSKEIFSILLRVLVNSILTTSLFISGTSTINFLLGPRWLVPYSFVYRLMVGSVSKFSMESL